MLYIQKQKEVQLQLNMIFLTTTALQPIHSQPEIVCSLTVFWYVKALRLKKITPFGRGLKTKTNRTC